MKRLLLLTVSALTIASVSHAQITKGTVLLGGSVQASSNKSEAGTAEVTSSGFQLSPSVGFTFRDNQVLGFSLSYGHTKIKDQGPTRENNAYGAGAYYRRYLTLGKGFYLFGQGGASYGYSKLEQPGNPGYNMTTQTHGVYAQLYPGFAYTVSKRFHLEVGMNELVGLGYSSSETETIYPGGGDKTKNTGFNFYTNVNPQSSLSVGFRIVLGK